MYCSIAVRLRYLLGNISVISDEDYKTWRAPSELRAFPSDLQNPMLEYSGLYEDGWAGEWFYAVLQPTPDARTVTVKGEVPQIGDSDFHTTARYTSR